MHTLTGYDTEKKKILTAADFWEAALGHRALLVCCFLPITYWQKRGLYLLLKHPSVAYCHLPERYKGGELPKAGKQSLSDCFNPVKIAKALYKEKPELLPFYLAHEFGIRVSEGINPLAEEETLGKLVKNVLSSLNHGTNYDVSAKVILPVNNYIKGAAQFPDKKEKALAMAQQSIQKYFSTFEVSRFLFLADAYTGLFGDKETPFALSVCTLADEAREICQITENGLNINTGTIVTNRLKNYYKHFKLLLNE